VNSIPKPLLDVELCKSYFDFHIYSFFLFNDDLSYIDFIRIATSNTESDVTN